MRCTYRWGCDVKVAAPATLLTDRPAPEDSPAQLPALGAILRDEWAGSVDPQGVAGALREAEAIGIKLSGNRVVAGC